MTAAARGFATVPLYATPPSPLGWHQVSAPGGYESWRFDAEDAAGEYRCCAEFVEGCCYHRGYFSAYRAYRRRPTHVLPPLPSDWLCVHFWLYQRGQRVAHFVSEHGTGGLSASVNGGEVSIGSSWASVGAGGAMRLELRSPGVGGDGDRRRISASFDFVPRRVVSPPPQSSVFPRPMRPLATPTRWGGEHWWLAAMPLCHVRGSVQVQASGDAAEPTTVSLAGRGCVDRVWGTAPPGHGFKRMMRGRMLLADRTLAFALAVGRRSRRTIAHLLEAEASSASITPATATARWDGRTPLQMRYPTRLVFEDRALELVNPTLLSAEPQSLHLVYELARSGGATAMCEIVYPRRLRWTAVNRLLMG